MDADALERVRAAPERFQPPVLYAMSQVLFKAKLYHEAAFWFYAGQLRARFDVNRSTDPTTRQALGITVDDFVIERMGPVAAVRNAPSPAATSSLAIAEEVEEQSAVYWGTLAIGGPKLLEPGRAALHLFWHRGGVPGQRVEHLTPDTVPEVVADHTMLTGGTSGAEAGQGGGRGRGHRGGEHR